MKRYELPDALRHDAHTLSEDVKSLLEATSELTDEKIAQARERLQAAVAAGQRTYRTVASKVVSGAKATDEAVHAHPYRGMAIALGVGVVIGYAVRHRRG